MKKTRIVWYGTLSLLVLYGVGAGVSRYAHMNELVRDLRAGTRRERIAAARELMRRDRLYDKMQEMSPSERVAAVDAVKAVPGELTVKQSLLLLKDADAGVRTEVTAALTEIGRPHVKLLVSALKDSDANVRAGAADALVAIGPPAIPYVQPAVREADLRGDACDILIRVGVPSVPALVELLEDGDQDVRMAAADTLGKIGSRAATPALLKSTRDVAAVRRIAISSLCTICDPRSTDLLVDVLAHHRDDGEVRARAARALSVIGEDKGISALVGALDDFDLKVRTSVITGLQRIGDRAVGPVAAAMSGGSKHIRRAGAAVLEKVESPSAAAALLKLARDPDPLVRTSAARGLGGQQGNVQVGVLVDMLSDEHGTVADAAADSLVDIGLRAVPALVSTLSSPGRPEGVKFRAATSLASIGSAAVPELIRIAGGGGSGAIWAAYALGRAGDPRARPVLRRLAGSGDPDLKWTAERALQRL